MTMQTVSIRFPTQSHLYSVLFVIIHCKWFPQELYFFATDCFNSTAFLNNGSSFCNSILDGITTGT